MMLLITIITNLPLIGEKPCWFSLPASQDLKTSLGGPFWKRLHKFLSYELKSIVLKDKIVAKNIYDTICNECDSLVLQSKIWFTAAFFIISAINHIEIV